MLRQEQIEVGGNICVKTYSDAGFMVRQLETGFLYGEAIDVPELYHYEETDEPIEPEDEPAEAQEILDILLGEEQ